VVATRFPDGAISPGGVGYDINCGVRLLASALVADEIRPHLADLASAIYRNCPSGVGSHGRIKLKDEELDEVLVEGARWALRAGYAETADLAHTEESGKLPHAGPAFVSAQAKERGRNQLGTLGAGNHFIEVDRVVGIFDEDAASRLGLFPDQVVVQIHCGSRGLGHQICHEYVSSLQKTVREAHIELPDRELVCAPLSSPDGHAYFSAMNCAANFAFANRQVLTHGIRISLEHALASKVANDALRQVYDIAHNMAKVERHEVSGQQLEVCVHRKRATRAFGPGAPGLPPELNDIGQPVLIPGSMGTESYVLIGTLGAMRQTFGSTCHGAGRLMSRAKAKATVRGEHLKHELESRGIAVRAGSMRDFAEETPVAYKDVSRVVDVVSHAGIAKALARLQPMVVIKG
jgi:tRNA-splicing ligase RtcB